MRYLAFTMDKDKKMPIVKANAKDTLIEEKYRELKERSDALEAGSSKELLVAFTTGLGVFGLAILGFRVLVAFRSSPVASRQDYTVMSQAEAGQTRRLQATEMSSPLVAN
jgi:hypothetical protein